jgi:hypothetical protein
MRWLLYSRAIIATCQNLASTSFYFGLEIIQFFKEESFLLKKPENILSTEFQGTLA